MNNQIIKLYILVGIAIEKSSVPVWLFCIWPAGRPRGFWLRQAPSLVTMPKEATIFFVNENLHWTVSINWIVLLWQNIFHFYVTLFHTDKLLCGIKICKMYSHTAFLSKFHLVGGKMHSHDQKISIKSTYYIEKNALLHIKNVFFSME